MIELLLLGIFAFFVFRILNDIDAKGKECQRCRKLANNYREESINTTDAEPNTLIYSKQKDTRSSNSRDTTDQGLADYYSEPYEDVGC